MAPRSRSSAELDPRAELQRPPDPTRPGPARPGSTGPPAPPRAPSLPRADGRLNGSPVPDPLALRRIAGTTSVRLDPSDREWLRLNRISVGEAVRAFVAAHRGDAEVNLAREREAEAERKLAALVAARKTAEGRLASRELALREEGARSEERRLAIDRLRAHFQVYASRVESVQGHLNWVEGRIASIPALRREDPATVLGELRAGAAP